MSRLRLVKAGRPRCSESHQAILEAAVALLEETSLRRLTVEGIAARAGVSKQTIYKWWPSKSALVMEAYAGAFGERIPAPNTGDFAADLREFTRRSLRMLRRPRVARALTGLLAEAQFDDEVHRDLLDLFLKTRRDQWRALFERGFASRQIAAGVDVELSLDLLFGPIWYRLLFKNGPLDEAFADATVEHLVRSLRAPAPAGRAKVRVVGG